MDVTDWAAVTAAATVVLAAVAIPTLVGTFLQFRLLRKQSEWEGRPYVSATVAPGVQGRGFWDLVLENHGKTIARNVVVDAGPLDLKSPLDHISASLVEYLKAGRDLGPGARERVMWRMNEGVTDDGAPAGVDPQVTATVTYVDHRGKPYDDSFTVDTDVLGDIAPSPTEGAKVQGENKELPNIERALRTLNVHVGELRR